MEIITFKRCRNISAGEEYQTKKTSSVLLKNNLHTLAIVCV